MGESLFCEPSSLRTLSGNIGTKVASFDSHLSSLKKLNESLKSAWEGDDIDKYYEAVVKQATAMEDLRDLIQSMAKFLLETANAYEETEKHNASGISM